MFSSILIVFPTSTYEQAVHDLPQFDIPLITHFGCIGGGGGTFDFIGISLELFCLPNADKGGCLNTSLGVYLGISLTPNVLLVLPGQVAA